MFKFISIIESHFDDIVKYVLTADHNCKYNVYLTTGEILCDNDPKRLWKAVNHFSRWEKRERR